MKTIKTRNTVKNVKVLDKSVTLSKRMKNEFVRTKDLAEETQQTRHASPSDYASSNIQDAARGAALETVHRMPNPRQKARDSLERAKGHFQEVKRNLPRERIRVAEQTANAAQPVKTNAIKLRSEADHAFEQAREAKASVKDARLALKEVKKSGRQAIREVKQDAQRNMRILRGGNPNSGTFAGQLSSTNTVMTRSGVPISDNTLNKLTNAPQMNINLNVGRSVSGASNAVESGITPVAEFSKKSFASQKKLRFSKLNPLRLRAAPPKAPDAKDAVPVNNIAAVSNSIKDSANPVIDGISRSSYTNAVPKGTEKAAQTLKTSNKAATTAKSVKSAKQSIKQTTKNTVRTAKKSVKTAEQSAKKAVKTAEQAAKTAQKTAKAVRKTAKTAERAARVTAKAAANTAKSTAKSAVATVKAAIAAVKGIVAILSAGGWTALFVILVICMIGLFVGSVFGIFFSSEPNESGQTINSVIAEIDAEYTAQIDSIINSNAHDMLDMSGARASWKEVLAVYTVKVTTDPDNPMEVATIDDTKAAILRSVFWEMNVITHSLDTVDVEEDLLDDDGIPTGETETVSKSVLRINVTHKTPEEMAAAYGFSDERKTWLDELLKPDYYSLWNGLLYGIALIGDGSMIGVAETQLGNVGGEPYWSWYGFSSREEWCACLVSWCAEQCGFIDAGIMPRFSGCMSGVQWFKDRGQWQNSSYTPRTGDIIFFDWDNNGVCDHVGIVESVADGRVNTIEGNSGDVCAKRSYVLGSVHIYGYGTPAYN